MFGTISALGGLVLPLRDRILLSAYFRPLDVGYFSHEHIANFLVDPEEEQVEAILNEFIASGLATIAELRGYKGPRLLIATRKAWEVRENRLRTLGRRHRALANQLDKSIESLILAIVNRPAPPGGYLASENEFAILELEIYLCGYDTTAVIRSCESLVIQGAVVQTTISVHGVEYPAIKPTLKGHRLYISRVRAELGVAKDEWILKDISVPPAVVSDPRPEDTASSRYVNPILLGIGAKGSVWRYDDGKLSRTVAIKFQHELGSETESLAQGRVLAQFNHEHIVRIYDCVMLSDPKLGSLRPALVLEYLAGETLSVVLRRAIPLTLAKRFATQLLAAWKEFRSAGGAHGDLHSENIMVVGDTLKVLDPWYTFVDLATRYSSLSRESRQFQDLCDCREAIYQILCQAEYDGNGREANLKTVRLAVTPEILQVAVEQFGAPSRATARMTISPIASTTSQAGLVALLDEINPEILDRFAEGATSVHVMLGIVNSRRLEELVAAPGLDLLLCVMPTHTAIIASSGSRIGNAVNDRAPSSMLTGFLLQFQPAFDGRPS